MRPYRSPRPGRSRSGRGVGGEGTRDLGFWFAALLVLTIGAILLRRPLLAVLTFTLALALGSALLWREIGFRNVAFRRSLHPARAFPDDEVLLGVALENAKLLPLPWAELREGLPEGLEFPGLTVEREREGEQSPDEKGLAGRARIRFSLWPYERIEQQYQVRCLRRGRYRFGQARLAVSDAFGFSVQVRPIGASDDLLVYPRLLPPTSFGLPAEHPFGDETPLRPLHEDPLRFKSVRPYDPADQPRRIHWRATARTGRLLSKQFEPGATGAIAVFLDLNTPQQTWEEEDLARLERAIEAAASVAAYGLEQRRQVGFFCNAPLQSGERFARFPLSRGRAQLRLILEALALTIPHAVLDIEGFILREARRMPWGTTIVVVTIEPSGALIELLTRLQRSGHPVTLLTFGALPAGLERRVGFAVHALGDP